MTVSTDSCTMQRLVAILCSPPYVHMYACMFITPVRSLIWSFTITAPLYLTVSYQKVICVFMSYLNGQIRCGRSTPHVSISSRFPILSPCTSPPLDRWKALIILIVLYSIDSWIIISCIFRRGAGALAYSSHHGVGDFKTGTHALGLPCLIPGILWLNKSSIISPQVRLSLDWLSHLHE